QYYVGSNAEHVALYRGISQDLAWVKLSEVEKDHPEIELKYLPAYQRKQVEDTIAGGSLAKAQTKISELSVQASACKKTEERRLAKEKADKEKAAAEAEKPADGADAKPGAQPTPAAPSPGPTLTAEEQKLASNCGKQ
ncbi:protein phosphatase, partial [Streptomyces anthocyanicus]